MNLSIKLSRTKMVEFFAEFLGTFFFMVVMFISPLVLRGNEPLVTAFMFIVLSLTFGLFAKGHFNPIFTFGDYMLAVYKAVKEKNYKTIKEETIHLLGYLVVQIVAGIVAFLIVKRMENMLTDFQVIAAGYESSPEIKQQLLDTTQYGTIFTAQFMPLAFVFEFFFSLALVLFYQFTAKSDRKSAMPYIVGLSYFVFSVLAKDISGASFNPMRSGVAAMFVGGANLSSLWLYIVAPLLGALVAAAIYFVFTLVKPEPKKS